MGLLCIVESPKAFVDMFLSIRPACGSLQRPVFGSKMNKNEQSNRRTQQTSCSPWPALFFPQKTHENAEDSKKRHETQGIQFHLVWVHCTTCSSATRRSMRAAYDLRVTHLWFRFV